MIELAQPVWSWPKSCWRKAILRRFRKGSAIGGVWQRQCDPQDQHKRGRVLSSTLPSSSTLNTAFSDFPIQAETPGPDPFFITQEGYMDYLDRYTRYFQVDRCVQLNTSVIAVQEESGGWKGRDQDGRQHRNSPLRCRRGLFGPDNVPRRVLPPGSEHFSGTILHL